MEHKIMTSNKVQNTEDQGTATQSVYNPSTIMWIFLIGLPLTLLFMILSKVGN